jgi:hypothetical protein
VAELIRDYGIRVNSHPCSNCERWSLYQIADPDEDDAMAYGFAACVVCDTNAESRRTANLEARR